MLGLRGGEGADVVVAAAGQRADEVGVLQIDEVLGGLRGVQFGLGGRTPAVRLGAVVLERVEGGGCAQEGWNIRGKRGPGEAVDEHVAVRAPAECGLDGEQRKQKKRGREAGGVGKGAHRGKYSDWQGRSRFLRYAAE